MAFYSKIYKATNLSLTDEKKVITQPRITFTVQNPESGHEDSKHLEQASMTNQIIIEAEEKAKMIIAEAEKYAHALEVAAQEKISGWWDENQQNLTNIAKEAGEKGYQEGFQKGAADAQAEVLREYEQMLELANQIIQSAYNQKEKIISEAEPFLLELSTAIAEQIVKQELTSNPNTFIELIRQQILRFKEKDFITICVHPDDFEFVQAERIQLIAVVNGETEIKIIPDHSVTPKGSVIRSAYGSVDARIDTQMEEIKKVILEARRESESGTNS